MKLTTSQILTFLALISGASLSKMKKDERNILIHRIRHMRRVNRDWEELVSDARKKLAPSDWDEVEALRAKGDGLSESERKRVDETTAEYDKALNECVNPELGQEHDIDLSGLTEGSVERLVDSNPQWKVGDIIVAYETILGDGEPTDKGNKKKSPKKQQ